MQDMNSILNMRIIGPSWHDQEHQLNANAYLLLISQQNLPLIMRWKYFLVFLFIPLILLGQEKHQYDKNLVVIRDATVYQQSIIQDPDKQLVDLETYIPNLALDIRYATTNNFTGQQIYKDAKAYVRLPVAKALKYIQQELAAENLGLKVFDAYRPYAATVLFYETYKDTNYVASPWQGSRHNRAAAVDVTLVDLSSGKALSMPSPYDDFSEKAHPDYMDLPKEVIGNRKRLIDVMEKYGFTRYPFEWWHFDYKTWETYELMDISFEQLEASNKTSQ